MRFNVLKLQLGDEHLCLSDNGWASGTFRYFAVKRRSEAAEFFCFACANACLSFSVVNSLACLSFSAVSSRIRTVAVCTSGESGFVDSYCWRNLR